MKKLLLTIALFTVFSGQIYSQDTVYIIKEIIRETVKEKRVKERPGKDVIPEKQNQISFGVGWVPYFNGYYSSDSDYFGSYSFGYTRHINERYSAGFKLSYLRASDHYYYYSDFEGDEYRDSRHFMLYTGHFNLNYYNRKNITLYMGAEIGLMTILNTNSYYDYDSGTYINSNNSQTVPIADLTAFGIRMRHKTVSPFFEVGLGLRGVFRGGVNFRF